MAQVVQQNEPLLAEDVDVDTVEDQKVVEATKKAEAEIRRLEEQKKETEKQIGNAIKNLGKARKTSESCKGCKWRLCVATTIGTAKEDYEFREVCLKCGKVRRTWNKLYASHTDNVVKLGPSQIMYWP